MRLTQALQDVVIANLLRGNTTPTSLSSPEYASLELESAIGDPQFEEYHVNWEASNDGPWVSMLDMLNQVARTLQRSFVVFLGSGEAEASLIKTHFGSWANQRHKQQNSGGSVTWEGFPQTPSVRFCSSIKLVTDNCPFAGHTPALVSLTISH